jgi:uncharacterized damage-inducible protein DinB
MKPFYLLSGICTCLLLFSFDSEPTAENSIIKSQLISDWERAKLFTKEYIDAMPEDGLAFKPSPEMRTFAEQLLHLSQGNIGLSSNGTGKERIYANANLEKSEEYKKSKEALSKIVMESYDFVIEGLKAADDSKWNEVVKRGNFEITRLAWVMKAFEHQTHHRGQCTIYLRLKGITPPNEKLF